MKSEFHDQDYTIKFCVLLQKSAIKTYNKLKWTFKDPTMSKMFSVEHIS